MFDILFEYDIVDMNIVKQLYQIDALKAWDYAQTIFRSGKLRIANIKPEIGTGKHHFGCFEDDCKVVHTVCMLSMYHGNVSWLCIMAMHHGDASWLSVMAMYHGYVSWLCPATGLGHLRSFPLTALSEPTLCTQIPVDFSSPGSRSPHNHAESASWARLWRA